MKTDLTLHRVITERKSSEVIGAWTRPEEWLPMPTIAEGEQKIVMLVAIFPDTVNLESAIYTPSNVFVDWGDGTPGYNFSSNTSHLYDFSALPDSTLTQEGFKQVFVTLRNTTVNLTSINLRSNASKHFCILDILARAPYMTDFSIQNSNYLKRIRFLGPTVLLNFATNSLSAFIEFEETPNNIKLDYLYRLNFLIRRIDLDFSGKTKSDFSMFANEARALEYVNLHGVQITGSCSQAFSECRLLIEVDGIDVGGATSLSSIFGGCYRLRRANITNIGLSISFENCKIHRAQLIEIFNNLITTTGKTINITGNPGVDTLTAAERAIATDKGWTITG